MTGLSVGCQPAYAGNIRKMAKKAQNEFFVTGKAPFMTKKSVIHNLHVSLPIKPRKAILLS